MDGLTPISKKDIDQLIKEGKIYATSADRDNGNSANANANYFGDNNSDLYFDNKGRIIEVQEGQDSTQGTYMGWADLSGFEIKNQSTANSTDDMPVTVVTFDDSTSSSKTTAINNQDSKQKAQTATTNAQTTNNNSTSQNKELKKQPQDLSNMSNYIKEYNNKQPQDLSNINQYIKDYNNKQPQDLTNVFSQGNSNAISNDNFKQTGSVNYESNNSHNTVNVSQNNTSTSNSEIKPINTQSSMPDEDWYKSLEDLTKPKTPDPNWYIKK